MKKKSPIVAIVMGSDSDLEVMKEAMMLLDEFQIQYDYLIASAHRTPDIVRQYVENARKSSIKVFIVGAGGAAHLPGIIAAYTIRPVIGVPIMSKTLSGIDSLYSIVQMPPGVPVATMAINGAKNAGLLAVQILAVCDPILADKMEKYKNDLRDTVIAKSNMLEKVGWKKYGK